MIQSKAKFIFQILLVYLTLYNAGIQAQDILTLEWEDLIPSSSKIDHPFEKLTEEQRTYLIYVTYINELERLEPGSASEDQHQKVTQIKARFAEQGIDVDNLMKIRDEIIELKRQMAEAIDTTLNNKMVLMPGYMLPLDYSDDLVTEFLLVPWVGACIHTPPPPKNQIVFVKIKDGYELRSIYEPVWIEGTMYAESSVSTLFLVDGTSNINSGYSIKADKIQPYK